MKPKPLTKIGTVVESLPNVQFRIETADGEIVRAYASGKIKFNRIKIIIGDRVEYVVDTQGTNNRIIRRL